MSFRNIIVEHGTWGMYRHFPSCHWCNREALFLITRTSNMSDNTYTDKACELHAKEWSGGKLPNGNDPNSKVYNLTQ